VAQAAAFLPAKAWLDNGVVDLVTILAGEQGEDGRAWRRRTIGLLAVLAYAGVVAQVIVWYGGVPGSRDVLVPLILGGLLAISITSIRKLRRFAVGVALDWLPFVLMLWLYDFVRGLAGSGRLSAHYHLQIVLDRAAGAGHVPTDWLQRHLWDGAASVHAWDYASWVVYMSYFFGTTAVLAVLWWRSRGLYWRFALNVIALAFLGCATFALYPTEPPWLAGQHGHMPPVERLIGPIGSHVPVITLQSLWETGTRYANYVAAVPSLHAAYTLLISLFLVRRLRSGWRHLLWLYPPAMAFALIYTGEHYLADIVLGWIYCLAVYVAVEWGLARWSRREPRPASERAGEAPAVPEPEPAG
jgi:hypothetical protein